MDTLVNQHSGHQQSERMLKVLRKLFPKSEMNRILDDVAVKRMPPGEFRTFVWHTMAKAVAQKLAGRPWERVDGDVRHMATQSAVIYAMHCIYERAAKGRSDFPYLGRHSDPAFGPRRQGGLSLCV